MMTMYPASLFRSNNKKEREEEISANSESSSVAEEPAVAAETQTEPLEPSEDNYSQIHRADDYYYGDSYNELAEINRLIREQQHELDTFKLQQRNLVNENERLRKEVREISEKEKNKLLGGGITNLPIPKFIYPPQHVLTNIGDRKLIDATFGRAKFTNDEHDDIYEFLNHLTKCQSKLNLSESDFQDVMLERMGPPALGLVSGWIDQKISMKNIYSQLHATFNSTISTAQAMDVLRNYTFPRGFNLAMVLSELQAVANYALRGGGESIENSILLALNVQEGLKRSMPERAYTIIFTSLSELRQVLGRAPQLPEILGNLQRIHEQVDFELSRAYTFRFGENRRLFDICSRNYIIKYLQRYNNEKPRFFNHPKIKEIQLTPKEAQQKMINYDIHKVDSRNTFTPNLPNRRFPMTSPKTGNKTYNGQNVIKPRQFNTKRGDRSKQPLCSMCGSYTHSAHDVCYSVMDDMGKIYEGPPAGVGCSICEKELNKDFRHLASHCPIRGYMMQMYKIGKYKPRGIFKMHYEKKLREGKI